jgi:hypothetical protein
MNNSVNPGYQYIDRTKDAEEWQIKKHKTQPVQQITEGEWKPVTVINSEW